MRSPRQHSWFINKYVFPFTSRVGADITVLREQEVDYDSDVPLKIAEVLIRKVPDDQQVVRVTVEAWYFSLVLNLYVCCFFVLFCFKSLLILCPFYCSSLTYELPSWGTWTRASQLCWVFWHKASLTMDGEERDSTSLDIYMRFKLDARRASALRSSALTVKERWEKNFIQY